MCSTKTDDATSAHAATSERMKAVFEREALMSWQHYKETGLHLTGDEVQAWLGTWGTGEESDLPPSHR